MDDPRTPRLAALDHAHSWHPFTPMRQWRLDEPVIIESAEGDFLVDTRGRRYIDGTSSLWCNVHGHRVPELDAALRAQLDRVAHSTMLGLSNVPATELAARLADLAPGPLNRVFYSDAGATAVEAALKMAIGYHFHNGRPERDTFLAVAGAYHGDTVGSMSVGYSDTFHRPFRAMTFTTRFAPAPDLSPSPAPGAGGGRRVWPAEDPARAAAARDRALRAMAALLDAHAGRVAGVIVEPLVQGASGMLVQPAGYLRGVADLARRHGALLIADEVATGFGRTGRMFACEHEGVEPDLMALGKGITGGYLPLAATLATDDVAAAFEGEPHEHRTLYHGHTYTGNPLGAAVALASLDLFASRDLLAAARRKADLLGELLDPLRDADRFPHVVDVRRCGLMTGIELAVPGTRPGDPAGGADAGDFGETATPHAPRPAYDVCMACRPEGVMVRPLGQAIVVMPPLAIAEANLRRLAAVVVEQIARHRPA